MTSMEKDKIFLKKIEEQKEKHRLRQKKYYEKQKNEKTEQLNKKITFEDLKELIKDIKPKKTIRTIKTIKTESTIKTYMNQIKQINNIILNNNLTKEEEIKIINFLKNNDNEIRISYLEDNKIEKTIEILRNHYKNDNTFRNILNIINILTNNNIDLINKLYSYYYLKIRDKRETNTLEEKDKDKIINLDRKEIIEKIEKTEKIEDKLILGLYLLIPSRRLEWRKVIIKSIKPQEENNNYLLLTDNSIDIVFNDYKTSKIYGEQIIKIDDDYLNKLIKKYIEEKELKEDDLLISQEGNKQKEINEGNFSRRVREVFRKVYNRDITIRFIRISHIVKFNRENIGCRMIDRRRLSEKMGHSIEEQLRYNKIF